MTRRHARIILKILHTLSAGGLIGGLAVYASILATFSQETAADYAGMRRLIAMVSNFVLAPSLAVAIGSGILSMVVHQPFLDKGWAWIKAASGILMFEATLVVVVAEANRAAARAQNLSTEADLAAALDAAMASEWGALGVVAFLCIANVVLGVWRPRLFKPDAADASEPAAN